MKKHAIFIAFLLFANLGFSQIIYSSWFPEAGDSQEQVLGTFSEDLDAGEPGLDQVWDFSFLEAIFSSGSTYLSPEGLGLPYSELFPEADLAHVANNNSYYIYYSIKNDTLKQLGSYFPTSDLSIFTDEKIMMPSPLPFGTSFEYPFTITNIDLPDYDTSYQETRIFKKTFDATGTVMTPSGTFENCYRIYTELILNPGTEEQLIRPFSYEWYKGKYSNIVARMGLHIDGAPSNFLWYNDPNNEITNTKELPPLDIQIKHLSKEQFMLTISKSSTLQISLFDLNGRILNTIDSFSTIPGNNYFEFPIDNFAAGTYGISIRDKKTQQLKSMIFVLVN